MSGLSPEKSEDGIGSDVECYQNYTAPEVFTQGLAGMMNQQDITTIIRSQRYMLTRFEKTNEMLLNCNALSVTRYSNAMADFKKHTQMLIEMRKDIDNIFRRIRTIKAKLAQQYPEAYEAASRTQRKEKNRGQESISDSDEEGVASVDPLELPHASVSSSSRKESDV